MAVEMRRLGLDIGTNSIGWCLTEDDRRIIDIGVRIFADGSEPPKSVDAPLAEKRRLAQSSHQCDWRPRKRISSARAWARPATAYY